MDQDLVYRDLMLKFLQIAVDVWLKFERLAMPCAAVLRVSGEVWASGGHPLDQQRVAKGWPRR